jgi:FO synthase
MNEREALRLVRTPARDLLESAAALRDEGKGRVVTFSPKVFIPLTRLCRDFCGYCVFRQSPREAAPLYLRPEDVLSIARAGDEAGCTEALFTLGERPEERYPEARRWLHDHGYESTLDYLFAMAELVIEETGLLPHLNPGNLTSSELDALRPVAASMGSMLEVLSERLSQEGGPHAGAPSKSPSLRLESLELAGRAKVAFTTGLLVGIGETREERLRSLLAIRSLNERYAHVQELIIQNFRAKERTRMAAAPDAEREEMLWTVSVSRLLLGPEANLQVPPNLSAEDFEIYLSAGINDWGGVSPVTRDFVNPEAPWPELGLLRSRTEAAGHRLEARLPVYPGYFHLLPPGLAERARAMSSRSPFHHVQRAS